MLQFQALRFSSRHFQYGFHRINLHCPTTAYAPAPWAYTRLLSAQRKHILSDEGCLGVFRGYLWWWWRGHMGGSSKGYSGGSRGGLRGFGGLGNF